MKERRSAGDKDGAATIKSLRKPTAAAWALNQLSRKNAKVLGDFIDLGERMRKAQRAALTGRGAAGLRDLAGERRKSVDDLTKKAIKHLGAAGDAQRDAIATSLEAALASEDAADELREGRLVKPLDLPSGFGDEVPGLSIVPDPAPSDDTKSTKGNKTSAADAAASARDRRRAARAQRRTTQDDQDDERRKHLERLADDKAAALEKAKEEAQAAAREAAAARAEVSRLQDELVSANGRAKAAAEKARVAQWTQSQAQQELDAATRRALDG